MSRVVPVFNAPQLPQSRQPAIAAPDNTPVYAALAQAGSNLASLGSQALNLGIQRQEREGNYRVAQQRLHDAATRDEVEQRLQEDDIRQDYERWEAEAETILEKRANTLGVSGQTLDTEEGLQQALDAAPDDYTRRAILNYASMRQDVRQSVAKQTLKRRNDMEDAAITLAFEEQMRQGDIEGAIETFNGLNLPAPVAKAQLAQAIQKGNYEQLYIERGEYDKARDMYRRLQQSMPEVITESMVEGELMRIDQIEAEEELAFLAINDPQTAKELLEDTEDGVFLNYRSLTPASRLSWINKMESALSTSRALERRAVVEIDDKAYAEAQLGRRSRLATYEERLAALGDPEAASVAMVEAQNRQQAMLDAYATLSDMEGKNPQAILSIAANASSMFDNPEGRDVYQRTFSNERLNAMIRQANEDPAAWYGSANTDVATATEDIQALEERLTSEEMDADTRTGVMRQLQGIYTERSKKILAAQETQGVPETRRQVITVAEATATANQINSLPPDQVVAFFRSWQERFPDPAHQAAAIKGLTTLPQGTQAIREEYQMLIQNLDYPYVAQQLATAIGTMKETADLTQQHNADINRALAEDPTLARLYDALGGSQGEGTQDSVMFRSTVEALARRLIVTEGMSPSKAVREAAKRSIETSIGFAEVNGQDIAIPRDPGNGKLPRDDRQIAKIGKGMTMALTQIDPAVIDLAPFAGLGLESLSESDRNRLVRQQILDNAYWEITDGGQSAMLFFANGDASFPLRDTAGQAFILPFDNLDYYLNFKRPSRGAAPSVERQLGGTVVERR